MLDWLGKDPSKAFPHFTGPWGQNQEFAGYIGAIWKALLWRSPSALKATGLDNSNRLRKLGDQLVTWGTAFQARGLEIDCCDEEKTPDLALCDELWRVQEGWESDADPEDYEPKSPPAGHTKDADFFRNLGLFGTASCRAFELADRVDFAAEKTSSTVPPAKKAKS